MSAPRWEYVDARGVTVRGIVERTADHGGTDVTYFMRRDSGELDLLSGSRLRAARVLPSEAKA